MNNNCEYRGQGGHCMCDACHAIRKAMEDAEKITKEEVDKIFCDAEKQLRDIREK